jgi:hypothetical protein
MEMQWYGSLRCRVPPSSAYHPAETTPALGENSRKARRAGSVLQMLVKHQMWHDEVYQSFPQSI